MTSFIDFARVHGVIIKDLYPVERIQRCATVDKPGHKNGAWFWDGVRGFVFDWAGEAKAQWFNDPKVNEWTPAEKRAWAVRRQTERQSQERGYENAALRADVMLRSAKPGSHNYLAMKGFPDERGFIAEDGSLLIPMRSRDGELQGLQVIRWIEADRTYEKKMLPGMRAKGAVFRLGPKTTPEAFLCEGYATGLSILAALRSVGLRASVLVCFSASNMAHVAPMVKGRCFVFADNDKSGAGEDVARKTGLPYCMAPEVGMDANDLHQKAGLMAVAGLLMQVRRREAEVKEGAG